MVNYHRMNKILEEEGTCEKSAEEEISFIEHESHEYISKMDNQSEEDANWQHEYYK